MLHNVVVSPPEPSPKQYYVLIHTTFRQLPPVQERDALKPTPGPLLVFLERLSERVGALGACMIVKSIVATSRK